RSALLHVLCKVHTVLISSGEFRYLYNDLFITDYCLWIQYVDDAVLKKLQKEVADVELQKSDVGLDLEDLELEGQMAALKVKEPQQLDSDDEPENFAQQLLQIYSLYSGATASFVHNPTFGLNGW
ncbi:hypothetical protein ANCDUO_26162, partial [Ancylostoma duodenale]